MSPTPSSAEKNLPSFLVLGADPYDIEWLLRNLAGHPDVYVRISETGYFSNAKRIRALGADWYASQFEPAEGERVIGEATLEYMQWRNRPGVVAKRIERILPDVRLIALLRNPVERLLLHWTALQRAGQVGANVQLLDRIGALDPERDPAGLVSGGWYARSLAPYRRLFGDRLLVVVHEDLSADPAGTFQAILRHIGADPAYEPEARALVESADLALPELDVDERAAVNDLYGGDTRRLAVMIGRETPLWNSSARRSFVWSWALPVEWEEASTWAYEIVRNITHSDYRRPTPRQGACVGEILEDAITRVRRAVEILTSTPREWSYELIEQPHRALREAMVEFATAVENGPSLPDTVETEEGSLPSRFVAYDVLVHHLIAVWELAVATGQGAQMPDRALRAAERFVVPFLDRPDTDASVVDSVVPPDDATATERFVALLGRDPAAWRARKEA